MHIVKPTTKEQLIDYLSKHISLGTYDRRFLDNLLYAHVATKKPVTSNQSDLLDTITRRYHRQLAKKELDSSELINLLWSTAPIASSPKFTQAHIAIEDENVVLRSPYKKDFVKSLKDLSIMNWDKDTKTWSTPANELSLKNIVNLTESHYPDVNYCPIVADIITTLAEYEEVKYWNPTLVRINGNLFIVACNNHLMEALTDITIDLSLASLAKLVHMGVHISQEVIAEIYESMDSGDEAYGRIGFALDPTPWIEISSHDTLIERLRMIDADMVLLAGWYVSNKSYVMEIANLLKANKIPHHLSNRGENVNIDFRQYKMPVKLELGISTLPNIQYIAKTIRLTNSTPVTYK